MALKPQEQADALGTTVDTQRACGRRWNLATALPSKLTVVGYSHDRFRVSPSLHRVLHTYNSASRRRGEGESQETLGISALDAGYSGRRNCQQKISRKLHEHVSLGTHCCFGGVHRAVVQHGLIRSIDSATCARSNSGRLFDGSVW